MADTPVFSIDLETKAFEKFKKDFDEFRGKLGTMPEAWRAAAKSINDAKVRSPNSLSQGEYHPRRGESPGAYSNPSNPKNPQRNRRRS